LNSINAEALLEKVWRSLMYLIDIYRFIYNTLNLLHSTWTLKFPSASI
jgi:SHS2 domain-containing protein